MRLPTVTEEKKAREAEKHGEGIKLSYTCFTGGQKVVHLQIND